MAGKTVVHGTPGPIRIAEAVSRSRTDAPEYRTTYRGEIQGVASLYGFTIGRAEVYANAAHSSFRQEGALATLEFTYKDDSTITETIEIDFNAVQRSWSTAPYYATLTASAIGAVEAVAQGFIEYAKDVDQLGTAVEFGLRKSQLVTAFGAVAGDAFEDLLMNGPSYNALLPVITYIRNVSVNFATPFIIADIGKVIYTSSLSIPTNPQFAVSEVTNTIGVNSLQELGWFKTGRYGIASDGGAQYVQQYIFDAYSTLRYTFV